MQSIYPSNSRISDEAVAGLLGLDDLRIGRHGDYDASFWVQSVWRARVVPAFDADAFLVAVTAADPWQPSADHRPGPIERFRRLLRGRVGPRPPKIMWRRIVVSLQGMTTVTDLPSDPVAEALRGFDMFEPYQYMSLDGIGYGFEVDTCAVNGRFSFGNPEAPSHRRLAAALLAVNHQVAESSGGAALVEYLKVWSRYVS